MAPSRISSAPTRRLPVTESVAKPVAALKEASAAVKANWGVRAPGPSSDFKAAATAAVAMPDGKKESFYDGALVGAGGKAFSAGTPLSLIPPIVPRNGTPVGKAIMVNGIRTDKELQAVDLQAVADKTGMSVIGIHNSTGGAAMDTVQSMLDKMNRLQDHTSSTWNKMLEKLGVKNPLPACQSADLSQNPATNTLRDTLLDSLSKGEPVHIVGHSQGALIVASALGQTREKLEASGMSRAEAEKKMSTISVETFGGAAHTYPDGPKYVHYVNTRDGVPGLMGLGVIPTPGKDAVVREFADAGPGKIFNFPCHYVETYLAHRVPFGEAFAQR